MTRQDRLLQNTVISWRSEEFTSRIATYKQPPFSPTERKMTSGLSRGPFFIPFKVGEGPPTIKSKETLVVDENYVGRQRSSVLREERGQAEMMPTSSGSEARWREEAMPGETFGEVMRRKASAEVMPPSVGRNALKSISDSNACFAGKLILVQRALSYR